MQWLEYIYKAYLVTFHFQLSNPTGEYLFMYEQ